MLIHPLVCKPEEIPAVFLIIIIARIGHERRQQLHGMQESFPLLPWHFAHDNPIGIIVKAENPVRYDTDFQVIEED